MGDERRCHGLFRTATAFSRHWFGLLQAPPCRPGLESVEARIGQSNAGFRFFHEANVMSFFFSDLELRQTPTHSTEHSRNAG
jgi:hypothetical protein